eukprot:7067265-Alexandrium_andersonii.AAC.1
MGPRSPQVVEERLRRTEGPTQRGHQACERRPRTGREGPQDRVGEVAPLLPWPHPFGEAALPKGPYHFQRAARLSFPRRTARGRGTGRGTGLDAGVGSSVPP